MKLRRTLEVGAVVALAVFAIEPLRAQFDGPVTAPEPALIAGGRAGLERSFDHWCAPLANSIVTLYAEPKQGNARRSTGVVVTSDGLILGKLSELGDQRVHAVTPDGQRRDANVLAIDLPSDLALLEIDTDGLTPLSFTTDHTWQVGQWIAAAGDGGTCVAVGIVSLPPRELPTENHGFLGVELAAGASNGVPIQAVVSGGAAAAVGLLAGDVILSIDGRAMSNRDSVQRYLRRTLPGQDIEVVLRRGDDEVVESVRVRSRELGSFGQPTHAADNLEVSVRRDGFELVVQHDAHVLPRECLAPALDGRGRIVGLHVARMDRPGSLLIPAEQVLERLDALLERAGRLVEIGDPTSTGVPTSADEKKAREV